MTFDAKSLALPSIIDLAPYKPGKPIDELKRELGLSHVIKLASNENPIGPSPKAVIAANNVINGLNHYPDSNGYRLKHKLAQKFDVNPEQISLGCGSDNLLALLCKVFLGPDEHTIGSQYGFVAYELQSKGFRSSINLIPTQNFHIDLDAIANAVNAKTKIIFLTNPNNPTGLWFDNDAFVNFMNKVPDNIIVVMDEAYAEFCTEANYPNSIELIKTYPNIITMRTFSKAYGLAGLRVGYSVSHPDVAELINRVRLPFNVNSVALAGAEAALEDDAHLQQTIETNQQGMQQLMAFCQQHDLDYIPSATNFLTINIKQDANAAFEALLKQGIIVRSMAGYGLTNYLRISIGNNAEMTELCTVLPEVLDLK